MKYAVIYQSQYGSTQKVAETIFETICCEEKVLYNLNTVETLPDADVYFVGFPIHDGSCSIDVMDCLDQLEGKAIALFATCGMVATGQYKESVEPSLAVWVPEESEYLGFFLCQGKIPEEERKKLIRDNPELKEKLRQLFTMGSQHPDNEDFAAAAGFAEDICQGIASWEDSLC